MNIPIAAAGYDPQKHGNNGQNVIDAIKRQVARVARTLTPERTSRSTSLGTSRAGYFVKLPRAH